MQRQSAPSLILKTNENPEISFSTKDQGDFKIELQEAFKCPYTFVEEESQDQVMDATQDTQEQVYGAFTEVPGQQLARDPKFLNMPDCAEEHIPSSITQYQPQKFIKLTESKKHIPSFIITPCGRDFRIPVEYAHKFIKINEDEEIPAFIIDYEEAQKISKSHISSKSK